MPTPVNIPGFDKPVYFPDGMTPDQIQQAIERDILPNKMTAGAPAERERPGAVARVGRGAQDVVDRIAQLTVAGGEAMGLKSFPKGLGDTMTQNMNAENAAYEEGRGKDAGIDVARIAGNIGMQAPLALIPGGKETALARAGAGAVQGAISGALQYDPTNSLKGTVRNTAVGAGTGAVVAPVAGYISDKVGAGVRNLTGRFKGAMSDIGADDIARAVPELTDPRIPDLIRADLIKEAQEQIKKTGKFSTEELSRKANLIQQGLTPTKSMVTRSPTDWTLERNLQKLAQSPDEEIGRVGQELTSVYQGNNQALTKRINELAKGLPSGTQEAHGMAVMQSLDDLSTATQKQVGDLYSVVRDTKGDQLASDAQKLVSTLEDLKDNTYAEKLVSSVTNKLKRFGMIDKEGALTSNTLTVTQAEELRKFVNTLPNDFGKKDIIRAIDSDVLSGMGEDAFGTARKAAAQRFDLLGNPATQKALNTLGELTQGKAAQNFIKSQVIDGAEQDVSTLISTLSKLPPQQAAEGINSLRAGVLQHLQDKAINSNSGQFSGASLNKAIKDIGEGKLLKILGRQQFDDLQGLARASLDATYQPAFSAVNNSNTAPMLMSLMQKARAIPAVPLLVTDEAQKIAARSGYKNQLAETLAAKPSGKLPELSPQLREFIRLFAQGATPASVAALNQASQPANAKPKDRQ